MYLPLKITHELELVWNRCYQVKLMSSDLLNTFWRITIVRSCVDYMMKIPVFHRGDLYLLAFRVIIVIFANF